MFINLCVERQTVINAKLFVKSLQFGARLQASNYDDFAERLVPFTDWGSTHAIAIITKWWFESFMLSLFV